MKKHYLRLIAKHNLNSISGYEKGAKMAGKLKINDGNMSSCILSVTRKGAYLLTYVIHQSDVKAGP